MFQMKLGHRETMAYQIYRIVSGVVLIFAVIAFTRGQWLLGCGVLAASSLSTINVLSYSRYKTFWLPPVLLSLAYGLVVVLTIIEVGEAGAYWAFPVLIALFWAHDRWTAIFLVVIFFIAVVTVTFLVATGDVVFRLASTLLISAVFFNIAAKIAEQQVSELEMRTLTDHLTGARNRRYMDEQMNELIERHRRTGSIATIISIDVDKFKKINDHYGHSEGDKVLIEVVQIIKSRVRSLDRVCRSGGEEFIILLPDTDTDEAKIIAEDLRRLTGEYTFFKDHQVTISSGIAQIAADDSRDAWLARADKAMYDAKKGGRDKVVVAPLTTAYNPA